MNPLVLDMELNGTLWNPLQTSKSLPSLLGKVKELTLRRRPPMAPSVLTPHMGEIKEVVVRVLELAEHPLSLAEIRRRCEHSLGRPVNDSTVKDCVHKHSRGNNALFIRVRRGRYLGGPRS